MANKKNQIYGGQAVIEGVMFCGKKFSVTAIRRKDQTIEYYEVANKEANILKTLKKIPFLRGIISLIQSSTKGSKHLKYSSFKYDVDPENELKEIKEEENTKLTIIIIVALISILSLVISKLVFTATPATIASVWFGDLVPNQLHNNLIEGGIKIILLITYILIISRIPFIKKIYQYHGAEHKVINAHEAGEDLNVDNVIKQSRFHYRCGSSFVILAVFIGIIVYSLYNVFIDPYSTTIDRIIQRVMLIPLIIGTSYEILRFTHIFENTPFLKWLTFPGIWIQHLTTKEPDKEHIEISIAAFKRMQALDRLENY